MIRLSALVPLLLYPLVRNLLISGVGMAVAAALSTTAAEAEGSQSTPPLLPLRNAMEKDAAQ
jgi:hypothetical protein